MSDDIKQRIERLRGVIRTRSAINGTTVEELDILAVCNALEEADKGSNMIDIKPTEFGSDILCKLVGADAGDDTITLKLPPGMRPRGMVIGEMIIIQRPSQVRSNGRGQ
jgi:hypothetical protein